MKPNREQVLSRYLDGELSPGQEEELRHALSESGDLEQLDAEFREIGNLLREQEIPPGMPGEVAWSDIRRTLRLRETAGEAGIGILGSRLKWAAAMMTLVFVLLGLAVMRTRNTLVAVSPAEVEWVDTDVPGATTMVYQDDETGLTVIWMMEEETDEHGNVKT